MFWYFVKLIVLLPLVGGMAFGALWLWRKYQPGLLRAQSDRALRIAEMLPVGTFGKLAVVEFDGKRLLVSVTRGRIEMLAEGRDVAGDAPDDVLSPEPLPSETIAPETRSSETRLPETRSSERMSRETDLQENPPQGAPSRFALSLAERVREERLRARR